MHALQFFVGTHCPSRRPARAKARPASSCALMHRLFTRIGHWCTLCKMKLRRELLGGLAVLCAAGSVVLAEYDANLRGQEGEAGHRCVH